MSQGGGLFQPQAGGRESTQVNKSTQVDIPRAIMVQSTLITCVRICAWALVCYGLIAVGSALAHYDRGWTSSYWASVLAGLRASFRVFRLTFWVPLVLCVWGFDRQAHLLIHYRWTAEQIDPHWPGPYKGRESSEAGHTFWDLFQEKHGGWGWGLWQWVAQRVQRAEPEEPEQLQSRVPPVIVQDDQGMLSAPSVPPMPEDQGEYKLMVFLRGTFGKHPVRPFSRDGAMQGGLYTRPEWEQLAKWCAHKDRQFYRPKKGLTAKGKSWARQTINTLVIDNGHQPPTLADRMALAQEIQRGASHPSHPIPEPGAVGWDGDDTTKEAQSD